MRSAGQQFESFMAVDRDRPSETVTQSYIICSGPRTGSSMLCRALIDTERAGMPFEYLSPIAIAAYARRVGAPEATFGSYFAFLNSNRSPGGVLGLKAHLPHLVAFSAEMQGRQAVLARFDAVVLVRRRNKVRQAVSHVRASMSGTWFADDPGHAEAARRSASYYDAAAIAGALAGLAAEDQGWDALFAATGRSALIVYYEDMVSDFPGTLRAISDHVGLGLTVPDNLTPPTVKLGDDTNAAWEERFRREVVGGYATVREADVAPALPLSAMAPWSHDHRTVTPPAVTATITVPLHNCARYVGELLASLFGQWRPEFELLLIDDASTDGGFGVVQAVLAEHPEVRATVMRTEVAEGMGLIARILRLAKGKIVVRADSDDLALPGRLDAVMSCFAADPDCRLVTSNALLISPESRPFGIYDTRSASAVLRDPSEASVAVGDKRWLGATIAYHRDVHDRFPPLDPELCPDGLDLLLPFRAVLLGSHHYLVEPLVGWRQHDSNTHRAPGHYGGVDGAREKYRAVNMMVLAQKVRDAAFLATQSPSPRFDEIVRRCRQRFDAEFDDWCRLRSRTMLRHREGVEPTRRDGRPRVPPIPTLAVGETLRFCEGEFGAGILPHYAGFHSSEHWGTWTERVAHLSLRLVVVPACAVRLEFRLVSPHLIARQRVSIRIDADEWVEAEVSSEEASLVELRCPTAVEARIIDIVILTRDAIVPAEMDAAWPDPRLLGVGLVSIMACPDVPPPG